METSVLKNGRIIIPAEIRERHNIKSGDKLIWIDDGQTIRVVPIATNPIKTLSESEKSQTETKTLPYK